MYKTNYRDFRKSLTALCLKHWRWLCFFWGLLWPTLSVATHFHIVAAENFYGELAKAIGGESVTVTNILQRPDQDPHLFNASPTLARAIVNADLIIYNGLGYDAWILPLLSSQALNPKRTILIAANLLGRNPGDNPHIWYDPQLMPILAHALLRYFKQNDPAHAADYEARFKHFQKAYTGLIQKIKQLSKQYYGTPITATEPVFGDMATHLGLPVLLTDFQQQVMNGNDPSLRQIKAFETILRQRKAHVLIYNLQLLTPLTQKMIHIANRYQIPIVGVTEIQPVEISYIEWMSAQLETLAQALEKSQNRGICTRPSVI